MRLQTTCILAMVANLPTVCLASRHGTAAAGIVFFVVCGCAILLGLGIMVVLAKSFMRLGSTGRIWLALCVAGVAVAAWMWIGGLRQEQNAPGAELGTPPRMVQVSVVDDTEKNPLTERAELWVRGHGSWWLTKYGSDVKNLGDRRFSARDPMMFYPDGRDGREIAIPYERTTEMRREGSVRGTIVITIRDDEVVVSGPPIEAETGEPSFTVER